MLKEAIFEVIISQELDAIGPSSPRLPGQVCQRILISSNLGITISNSVCLEEDLDPYLIAAE